MEKFAVSNYNAYDNDHEFTFMFWIKNSIKAEPKQKRIIDFRQAKSLNISPCFFKHQLIFCQKL